MVSCTIQKSDKMPNYEQDILHEITNIKKNIKGDYEVLPPWIGLLDSIYEQYDKRNKIAAIRQYLTSIHCVFIRTSSVKQLKWLIKDYNLYHKINDQCILEIWIRNESVLDQNNMPVLYLVISDRSNNIIDVICLLNKKYHK